MRDATLSRPARRRDKHAVIVEADPVVIAPRGAPGTPTQRTADRAMASTAWATTTAMSARRGAVATTSPSQARHCGRGEPARRTPLRRRQARRPPGRAPSRQISRQPGRRGAGELRHRTPLSLAKPGGSRVERLRRQATRQVGHVDGTDLRCVAATRTAHLAGQEAPGASGGGKAIAIVLARCCRRTPQCPGRPAGFQASGKARWRDCRGPTDRRRRGRRRDPRLTVGSCTPEVGGW